MAQLERFPRQENTSKSHTSPSVENVLRASGGEASKGSSTSTGSNSPLSEDDNGSHQKKSVLSKVKEKAKKLRHSLSKKKHDDGNVTPAWGISTEDEEEEEDAEYLGAPMYESELAPEAYKENARQHPRATPVIAENHVLQNPLISSRAEMDREKPISSSCAESKRTTHHHQLAATTSPLGSNKTTMTGNVAYEKLTPAYTRRSDAGHSISSEMSKSADTSSTPPSRKFPLSVTTPAKMASKLSPVASKAPRVSSAPSNPGKSSPSSPSALNIKNSTNAGDQTWDKGVSVKEYFKNKLEPGEDEKALSQVISEAMSPRRTPGDVGVMEKVREAVTSLLRNDEPSPQYAVKTPTAHTSSQSPVPSSNVHQVGEEENHGRILQTN